MNELIENSKKEFEQNSDDKKIFNNLIEKITFKNVDYKFDIKGDSVLKNINFDIPQVSIYVYRWPEWSRQVNFDRSNNGSIDTE